MPRDLDPAYRQEVVARGLLSESDLREEVRRRDRDSPGMPLLDWLCRAGRLTPEQTQAIAAWAESLLAAPTISLPAAGSSSPAPPMAQTWVPSGASHAGHPVSRRTLGKYVLRDEIGRGGMGVVYCAHDPDLNRLVAVKTVSAHGPESAELHDRLQREARTAATLDHPGIVRIYEVGTCDGAPFFAMELLRGRNVGQALRDGMLADRKEQVRVILDATRAVAHAHGRGIIHRDLKPSNLWLDESGRVVVMDFGLARHVEAATHLTGAGQAIGTPNYMPPEQVQGVRERIGPWSDVYALGAVLYEMLTGRPPFYDPDPRAVLYRVVHEELVPPRGVDGSIPAALEAICLRCLEKEPRLRYASAAGLAVDLERYGRGLRVAAWTTELVRRAWRRGARRLRGIAPWAAGLLAVAGVVAFLAYVRLERDGRVESALGRARVHREAGEVEPALEAYREALAVDGERREALEGKAWGEQERAAAEEQRQRRTRLALAKAKSAADVLARWGALASTLGELEAACFDSRQAPEERRARGDAAWPAVERFIAATPADDASQATMKALVAWAARLAGRSEQAAAWAAEARRIDADMPYGALLEGFAVFAEVLAQLPLPQMWVGVRGLEVGAAPGEPAALVDLRRALGERLEAVRASPVWGAAVAAGFVAAVDGIGAFREGRYAEAAERLAAALKSADMAPFASELRLARARACHLTSDFAGALADLQAVSALRPAQAEIAVWTGVVLVAQAAAGAWQGADRLASLDRAIVAFDRAAELAPQDPRPRVQRAIARISRAEAVGSTGGDADPDLRLALADLDAVAAEAPGDPIVPYHRALVHRARADLEEARGADPRPRHRDALADLELALRGDDAFVPARNARGCLFQAWGRAEAAHAGDPIPFLDRALADFDAALVRQAGHLELLSNRGLAHRSRADAEADRGLDPRIGYERALADFDAVVAREPFHLAALVNRATTYLRRAEFEAEESRDPAPDLGRCLAGCDTALARHAGYVPALTTRAQALEALGRFPEAREAFARAREHGGTGAVDVAAGIERVERRLRGVGAPAAWDRTWKRIVSAFGRKDREAARRLLDRMLVLVAASGRPEQRPPVLAWAHYNLACLDAGPAPGGAGAPSPADAAAAVERAFGHLERAVELGWSDRAMLEADADLAPLRRDPRWGPMVARVRAK